MIYKTVFVAEETQRFGGTGITRAVQRSLDENFSACFR
jgi:hypothetical protein